MPVKKGLSSKNLLPQNMVKSSVPISSLRYFSDIFYRFQVKRVLHQTSSKKNEKKGK